MLVLYSLTHKFIGHRTFTLIYLDFSISGCLEYQQVEEGVIELLNASVPPVTHLNSPVLHQEHTFSFLVSPTLPYLDFHLPILTCSISPVRIQLTFHLLYLTYLPQKYFHLPCLACSTLPALLPQLNTLLPLFH